MRHKWGGWLAAGVAGLPGGNRRAPRPCRNSSADQRMGVPLPAAELVRRRAPTFSGAA